MLDPTDACLGHLQFAVQEVSCGREYGTSGAKGYTFNFYGGKGSAREGLTGLSEEGILVGIVLRLLILLRPLQGRPLGLIGNCPVNHIENFATGENIEPVWLIDVSI